MATALLTPYLLIKNGNAREALEFYQTVFGGKVEVMTFGELPDATDQNKDLVMHGALEEGDVLIYASDADGMQDTKVSPHGNVTLALNGDDTDKLTGYYEKLKEGGQVIEPLAEAPWGDSFGTVEDKYQVSWMFNIAGEASKGN